MCSRQREEAPFKSFVVFRTVNTQSLGKHRSLGFAQCVANASIFLLHFYMYIKAFVRSIHSPYQIAH